MSEQIDVKALRKALGWKQAEMAHYLGLERSWISRVENGRKIGGPASKLLRILVKKMRSGASDVS